MKNDNQMQKRFFIALIFLCIVFLPLFSAGLMLSHLVEADARQQISWRQHLLNDELKQFQADLIPSNLVEKIILNAAEKAGLDFANERIRLSPEVDPGIIDEETIPRMLAVFNQYENLNPLIIVTYNADIQKIRHWFSKDFDYMDNEEKELGATVFAMTTGRVAKMQTIKAGDQKAADTFKKHFELALQNNNNVSRSCNHFMVKHLSSLAGEIPTNDNIVEVTSEKNGFGRVFILNRNIRDGEKVYGGFFIAVSAKDLNPQKFLKIVTRPALPVFKRAIPGIISDRIFSDSKNTISSLLPFPAETAGYLSFFQPDFVPPESIKVTSDLTSIIEQKQNRTGFIGFAIRITLVILLTLLAGFTLFGFPEGIMLRIKILGAMAFIVFMPYVLMLFLMTIFLQKMEGLEAYNLRSEAQSRMADLENYFNDQKLQQVLRMVKTRERLMNFIKFPDKELLNLHSHNVVFPDSDMDLHFVRNDGFSRSFRARHPGNQEIIKVELLAGTRLLSNIGFLDNSSPANKKALEFVSMAEGFLESNAKKYKNHETYSLEGRETRANGVVDEYSRMIYMLVPDNTGKIAGIAFANIASPNYIIYRPWEFDFRIFSDQRTFSNHRFSMAHRRYDQNIINIWPYEVRFQKDLKVLFNNALRLTDSGFNMRYNDQTQTTEFRQWRYSSGEAIIFAGISQSSPDRLTGLLTGIFPFLLLTFAFLSVVLSADIFSALFILPVRVLRKGAEHVSAGNYMVRIQCPDSDEFAQLSASFNRMAAGLEQREKMRRFVSDDLYHRLADGSGDKTAKFEKVSLLASDIRGFTSISEKYDPQEIVSLLNDYFTRMESAIKQNGGRIERFVGDALTALFYSDENGLSEYKAVRAAVEMRKQLAEMNLDREKENLFSVDNGIGIASGTVASGMAGDLGGRMIFTVIGEAVSLSEKLESLTKEVKSRIAVCDKTAAVLKTGYILETIDNQLGLECFAVQPLEKPGD